MARTAEGSTAGARRALPDTRGQAPDDLARAAHEAETPAALAELLRRLRRRHARQHRSTPLTVRELAERTGYSRGAISEYLSGRTLPPIDRFDVLAQLFDATAGEQRALATARDRMEERRRARRPAGRVPAELPPDVSVFTGRERELAALDQLRSREGPAIYLISGTAGVGKTGLATHWAHRAAGEFPDGQLYANLRGYDAEPPLPPTEVLARFLRTLGMPAEQVPTDPEEAAAAYRSRLANRRVLVLLDNAAGAEQVRPLLPGGGECATLVTSRNRLAGLVARDGAVEVALAVLSDGESRMLLRRLLGADRDGAESSAVRELADLCGRLPLALRIAAAHLAAGRRQPIADYVHQLRDNQLSTLAVDGDQQAAVAAAFAQSYARVPEPTRRIFRLLGLAPGPDVTAEAVAAMAGTTPERGRRELAALAAMHLVEEHAPGRYACHDLLRAYARDRIRSEETAAVREAALGHLYAYHLTAAGAAAGLLYPHELRLPRADDPGVPAVPFPDQGTAVRWLDTELPNLVAAARHAMTGGTRARAFVWLLADALRGYLRLRGRLAEAQALVDAALATAEAVGNRRAQGSALLGRAGLRHQQGRWQEARDDLHRALAAFREAGWDEGCGVVLGNLGAVYLHLGRLHEALSHYREALAANERTGSRPSQVDAIGSIALNLMLLGRLPEAATQARRALSTLTGLGSGRREGENQGLLGDIHRLRGEFEAARRCYLHARVSHRKIGDRDGEAAVLPGLALVHCDRGRLAPARKLALASLRIAGDAGNRRYEVDALTSLARVYQRCGDVGLGLQAGRRARELADELGDRHLLAESLVRLAELAAYTGEHGLARASVDRVIELTDHVGYRLVEGQARTASAAIHLAVGDLDVAVDEGQRALAIHQETGHRPGEARTHFLLNRAQRRVGEAAAARVHGERASRLIAEMGIPEGSVGFLPS